MRNIFYARIRELTIFIYPNATANYKLKDLHCLSMNTPDKRQSKTPILSRNVDQKSIETALSIVICRQCGDKWQSKTLFLSIFDPRSSIVDNVFDCRLSGLMNKLTPFLYSS